MNVYPHAPQGGIARRRVLDRGRASDPHRGTGRCHGNVGAWPNAVSVGPLNFAAKDKNDYGGDMRPSADFAKKVQGFFPQLLADDLQPYQVGIQARLAGCQDWVHQARRH